MTAERWGPPRIEPPAAGTAATVVPAPTADRAPHRRRGRVALFIAGGVLFAAIATTAWLRVVGDDEPALPGELREEPTEQWSSELDGRFIQIAAGPESTGGLYMTVVGDSATNVLAVDAASGAQRWSAAIDPSSELGYGSLSWSEQGLVSDYGPYGGDSRLTFLDPATGAIEWQEAGAEYSWSALNNWVLSAFDDERVLLATFDVTAEQLGEPIEADDYFVGLESLYLVDGRRITTVDSETLDPKRFAFDAPGDVVRVVEDDGGPIVVIGDRVMALTTGGDPRWTVAPDIGQLTNAVVAGTNLVVSGESGTALVDVATGRVADRVATSYRVDALTEHEGRSIIAASDTSVDGEFEDVVIGLVDVTEEWHRFAEFPTRNTFGRPVVTIVGSVVYADETGYDDGGEPDPNTVDRRFAAYDLEHGDALWSLHLPFAQYAFASPAGLFVVEGRERATLSLYQ